MSSKITKKGENIARGLPMIGFTRSSQITREKGKRRKKQKSSENEGGDFSWN
jgi:hypothetical protein